MHRKTDRSQEFRHLAGLVQIVFEDELGEDPDVLLALAGKVSNDLQETIRRRPRLFAALIRELKGLPDEAVEKTARRVRDGKW